MSARQPRSASAVRNVRKRATARHARVHILWGCDQPRKTRMMRARGVGMIYISHKLDEVFHLADRITVLRDGRSVGTNRKSETSERAVIAQMVGREVDDIFPTRTHAVVGDQRCPV